MFKNYFKLAYRNILKDKRQSVINILGLAIGLSSTILILLWVKNERSYDKFHEHADRIYRINCEVPGLKATLNAQAMPAGIKSEIPVIKNAVRLSMMRTAMFESGSKKFEETRLYYADSTFLDIFSFPLLLGDRATALKSKNGVLITRTMAAKYFGPANPIGKVMRKDNRENLVVTGVLADVPDNSDMQFDFIMPLEPTLSNDNASDVDKWENFNYYTYLQFTENFESSAENLRKLENKMHEIFHRHSNMQISFQLEPLTNVHLAASRTGDMPGHGNAQYVYIFYITAILILIVACINFMNLATARSGRRAKEIGLRKVAGATRSQLIFQFLSESVFISFLSLLLALGIVELFLPVFNNLADRNLFIPVTDIRFWLAFFGVGLLTGLISGSYPALFLSGFDPAKVLKGNIKSMGANIWFRNALVVTQFTVSILLLVGTVVIYNQLKFIKDRNPGFEKENLVYMPCNGEMWKNRNALINELKQNTLTSNFAITSDLPTNLQSGNMSANWRGKDPNLQVIYQLMDVNEDFIKVFQLKLLNGRSFSGSFPADSNNFMINEKMAGIMGLTAETAVGKGLTFTQREGVIVGVVKNFNYKPVQTAIEPLILRYNKNGGFVVVRAPAGQSEQTIKAMSGISQRLNPAYPFQFNFVDQDIAGLYRGEQQMGNIFNLFAILGGFISCLGLYGLSAFVAEQRTKEIGVRKVLGASVINLVYLLSTGITRLILVAIFVAIPLSWYAANKWLSGFAYHIQLSWLIFLTAALSALVIAWLTVSFESVKAATSNPIKSLRAE